MKRIFAVIMIIAMLALLALPVAASEIVPEEPATESTTQDIVGDNEGELELFDRLVEIWDTYSAEILSGGGIFTVVGGLVIFWRKIKPLLQKALTVLSALVTGVDDETKKPTQQSRVLNGIVDGVEKLDKRIEALDAAIQERDDVKRHFEAVEKELCALARALTLVYSNSKLPQGVKDQVSLECAECISTAREDIKGVESPEVSDNE